MSFIMYTICTIDFGIWQIVVYLQIVRWGLLGMLNVRILGSTLQRKFVSSKSVNEEYVPAGR